MKHVTFHLPSFLRRVRIHGGEFDSSARAMNREKQVRLLQADLRIVRGSTIERKQMSTTIKRVALVAVAALGLGVLSVVPSNAANQMDSLVVSATTAAQETGDTATATSATATLTFLATDAGDTMSVTASLVSAPAGNTKLPVFDLVETTTAIAGSTAKGGGQNAGALTGLVQYVQATGATTATAKYKVYINAPTVVGAYVVKLTPAVVAGGGSLNATAQTITITVTQKASADTTVSATASTSILNAAETITATADATVTGSMTVVASPTATGTISVTLKNAAGTAQSGESYTASILSGPGLLGSGVQVADNNTAPTGRALTVRNGDVVGVFPDGTSGVSKIEIRTAAGVLIGTETVTFFGAVASIVATVVKPVIGVRAELGVVTAVAKDAAGTTITAPTLYITSGTTTIISQSYAGSTTSAAGVATFPLTGVKAGTASIVVSNGSTAALSTVSAAAVSVRVGGGSAELDGVIVAFDKTSYAPGEAATVTVTPTDAAGLTLADETYTVFTAAGLVASYSLPSGSETITLATAQNGGVAGTGTAKGVATYKIYMPSIEGDFKLSWTRSASYATAANDDLTGSITVAVSSPGTAAATDAANEATDAANAATDAALAAAEAADAATTAAQEASDAVAALSESVTKLIAGLQAQIKSLATTAASDLI